MKFTLNFVTVLVFLFSFSINPFLTRHAEASPHSTSDFLSYSQGVEARGKLTNFFSRDEVIAALKSKGIDYQEAQARVSSLTDQEAFEMSKMIDQLPVGGHHGVGTVVGAILVVFIVLLFTDILGLTKVFPFTRSVR